MIAGDAPNAGSGARRHVMTYRDMVAEIVRLPVEERLLLLEELTRSLRADLGATGRPTDAARPKLSRGMLKPAGPPPGDLDLRRDYVDYLIRKYL